MNTKKLFGILLGTVTAVVLTGCGGGGGGGGHHHGGGSAPIITYPYETLFGDVCTTHEPTPGCTFFSDDGTRITVEEDGDYDLFGNGSDDLWFVVFDGSGTIADVYDEFGVYQYSQDISDFDGWVGGSTIGLGTTGLFWEDVTNGEYWFGANGVLYSANIGEANWGEAINNEIANDALDTNFAALSSEANLALVKKAAKNLQDNYGFKASKAKAVASALNKWGVAAAERGFTTSKDMDRTFKSVFGVDYLSALTAVQDFTTGDVSGMQTLTNRSASALGLKPHMAKKFVKGMYKRALASWGYDVEAINW